MRIISYIAVAFVLVQAAFADNEVHTFSVWKAPVQVKRQTGTHETVELGGGVSTLGLFYANIAVGTPPQTFGVQLDTGSSDLLLYTKGCNGCNGTLWDISRSSTFAYVSCQTSPLYCAQCGKPTGSSKSVCAYTDTYGDGSQVTGFVSSDKLAIGPIKTTVTLGTIFQATEDFQSGGSSGIWGLGYQPVSGWGGLPAFDRLVLGNPINNVFSMCLQETGGTFTVGGSYNGDTRFKWIPYDPSGGHYAIQMTDLLVGTTSLGLPAATYSGEGCIVDSGATQLLLQQSAYSALQTKFASMCGTKNLVGICGTTGTQNIWNNLCYIMTTTDVAAYPNLTVSITGSGSLTITPDDYLFPHGQFRCMGIGSITGIGVSTILGDAFIRHFNTVFDRVNKKIGFGDLSTCPSGASSTTAKVGYDHTYTFNEGLTTNGQSVGTTVKAFAFGWMIATAAVLMM